MIAAAIVIMTPLIGAAVMVAVAISPLESPVVVAGAVDDNRPAGFVYRPQVDGHAIDEDAALERQP